MRANCRGFTVSILALASWFVHPLVHPQLLPEPESNTRACAGHPAVHLSFIPDAHSSDRNSEERSDSQEHGYCEVCLATAEFNPSDCGNAFLTKWLPTPPTISEIFDEILPFFQNDRTSCITQRGPPQRSES